MLPTNSANIRIIIPARLGSKGMPGKNRLLLHHTLKTIPADLHSQVIITTNDNVIIDEVKRSYNNCSIHLRTDKSARDSASTKECLEEVIRDHSLKDGTDIIMLYLTYPERSWLDIIDIYKKFIDMSAKSMLCKIPVKEHPYMCMLDIPGGKGQQLVPHNLCRRQDYPNCFRISHMVSIFKVHELKNLKNNLYNKDTIYHEISDVLDVDTPDDFKKVNKDEKN